MVSVVESKARQARTAQNIAMLIVLRVAMPLLSIALIMAISRLLGAKGLGQFTLAYSYLGVFNAIAPLGLNPVVTRDGAREPSTLHTTLAHAMTLCMAHALVLTALMCGLAVMLDYEPGAKCALLVLSLAIIPCTVGVLLDAASMAIERVDQVAKGIAVEYVIKLGFGIALLLLGFGLQAVLLMSVIGKVMACLVQIRLLQHSRVQVRLGFHRSELRKLLRLAPAFLGISVFATLYWRIDILMLSRLRPVEDVGYYGAAYRILELAMILPQSATMAIYPQIVAAVQCNLGAVRRLGATALRYLTAFTLPTAVCAIALAQPGLALLYGPSFSQAESTLAVLILVLVPYAAVRYHAYVLVSANRQNIDLAINVVMVAINVLLNLWLIPKYSHLGAAIATFVAIVVYASVQWYYLNRSLPGYASTMPTSLPLICATVLAGLAAWMLRSGPLVFAIGIASLVYGCVLIRAGFFLREELAFMGMDRLLLRLKVLRRED
jgi:O-antigen/teichoic acid export membrane protein